MINYKELRIGNFISHNKNEVKVFELPYLIDLDENKEGYLINSIWADEFEPILLTPEILERCGFVLDKGVGVWFNVSKSRTIAIWDSHLMDYKLSMADNNHILVNSLHQLQNLYFALTSEELQYTPCK